MVEEEKQLTDDDDDDDDDEFPVDFADQYRIKQDAMLAELNSIYDEKT